MVPCPSCKIVAFSDGRCRSCGFQVVQGQRSSGPAAPVKPAALPADALQPVLEPSALVEVSGGGGPSMPGFESTSLVTDAGPQTPDPAALEVASCPRCRTPQPSPGPAACDRCGYRLKPRRSRPQKTDENIKVCTECRMENDAERTVCINCSFRLPD